MWGTTRSTRITRMHCGRWWNEDGFAYETGMNGLVGTEKLSWTEVKIDVVVRAMWKSRERKGFGSCSWVSACRGGMWCAQARGELDAAVYGHARVAINGFGAVAGIWTIERVRGGMYSASVNGFGCKNREKGDGRNGYYMGRERVWNKWKGVRDMGLTME